MDATKACVMCCGAGQSSSVYPCLFGLNHPCYMEHLNFYAINA